MTTATDPKAGKPSFGAIAQHFSPAWFAAVMGTAVIPLAVSFVAAPWVRPVAALFMVLAAVMFVAMLVPWSWRFIRYPEDLRRDLRHPVAANFFPTMPISLIIIGLDLLRYPDLFFTPAASRGIAFVLWLLGAVGIYGMGFVILERIFRHDGIKLSHAKLVIPVAGFELAQLYPTRAELTFGLSMISLGVGFFLFLFVGAAVYHRHIFEPLPMSRLAATFFIGIAPPAILAVILFKMMHLFEAQPMIGVDPHVFASVARLGVLMLWGFATWWFFMALLVVGHYLRRLELPYALSWWAFTFPTGALAVATGAALKVTGYGSIRLFYYGLLVFLLVAWGIVALRTVRAALSGQVFAPAH
jgi:C4-dicarboxylate transporter/malic acid transport protein